MLDASGEYVVGRLRPEDRVHPPIEGRGIRAPTHALAVALRERDPGARKQPEEGVALLVEPPLEPPFLMGDRERAARVLLGHLRPLVRLPLLRIERRRARHLQRVAERL